MLLKKIIKELEIKNIIGKIEKIDINFLSSDSNNISENSLFFCLKGVNTDGHNYVLEAQKNGAVALIVEKKVNSELPQIIVENSRKALSICAKQFYENACESLKIIGITGTNGKTSTTYIMKSILESVGKKVAVIGTLGLSANNKTLDINLTTPDPVDLHEIFYNLKKAKVEYVIMEVSAHAIALYKIFGIKFEIGVFTNLSQDHLDFFKTMDCYGKVKKSFFEPNYIKCAVSNADDNMGREIISDSKVPVVSYAIKNPSDVFAINIQNSFTGTKFTLNLFDNVIDINTKLIGEFNVQNIMAGATACAVLGISAIDIKTAIEECPIVEGRFNVLSYNNFHIIIDFAHTPDGLNKLFSTARALCDKRLISIFGSGGSRDIEKRPLMGKEADKYCDFIILTSDNARYENPELICQDILKGIKLTNYIVETDRKKATEIGMMLCQEGDCLVIAGKGGEKYQDINGVKTPYQDIDVVNEIIEKMEKKNVKQ